MGSEWLLLVLAAAAGAGCVLLDLGRRGFTAAGYGVGNRLRLRARRPGGRRRLPPRGRRGVRGSGRCAVASVRQVSLFVQLGCSPDRSRLERIGLFRLAARSAPGLAPAVCLELLKP
jgi:hypothetical protein